jgi:predicted AAA+ superfamily ATPase
MKKNYLPRIADKLLSESLESSGAVLIEGPKWCGKTRTAEEKSKSILYLQNPDKRHQYMEIASTQPSLLLEGDTPRLLDEWQEAPVLWDAARYLIDQRCEVGQFIFTGSVIPPKENKPLHSGAGRFSRMKMRTMSLFESKESTGDVSISKLFEGNHDIKGFSKLSLRDIAEALTRGGWPASVLEANRKAALKRVYNYLEIVINEDISAVDDITKNPHRVRTLMRSLARNVATAASINTIRKDVEKDDDELSPNTITQYINALRLLFVVEDLPAWNPQIRSKSVMRTSSTRHFTDPSIAAAVLRASADKLLDDFETFGLLFESMCVRDLRVYAEANDGDVFYYRDNRGLEVDCIVELKDGRWGAIEIKLGASKFDDAAKNLKALKDNIDIDKMSEPAFLMILSGTDIAYKRTDGVLVVPLGCLRD